MRWLELTVEAHSEAVEAVSEIFGRLGHGAAVRPTQLIQVPGEELAVREDPSAPYLLTAHVPDDLGAPAAIESTERALWHLQAFGLGPIGKLRVASVDDSDWTEAWKHGYAPQRIGRIVIVPSWLDEPMYDGELQIRLDPGMAFGTGLHPTTRGGLTLLQRITPMPDRCLDVGTGSGILGIAAPGQMEGDRFPIPRASEHLVTRVPRLRDGEEVGLLDGRGIEARCRLDNEGSLDVLDRGAAGGEPRHRLAICQALLKGDGLE